MPPAQWRTMPPTMIFGIGFWVISWIGFLFYIYFLTHDVNWILKLTLAACFLTYFLLRAHNWARIIALMANMMTIVLLMFLAYTFSANSIKDVVIALANVMFFGTATYFLYVRSTADFFKAYSQSDNPQNGLHRTHDIHDTMD